MAEDGGYALRLAHRAVPSDNGCMTRTAIVPPDRDPTPIFELFRGSYGSELLAAAVAHFDLFGQVAAAGPTGLDFDALSQGLGLARRPAIVLITAMRAMGLLVEVEGQVRLTDMAAEHLICDGDFFVGDYVGLAAQSPGVLEMVERLKTNRPAGADEEEGAAFIYRDGMESAMEAESSARHLTLALAGRAKNVAPHLAANIDWSGVEMLLDLGGGTGIYAIAALQANPKMRAIVLDRPEVLKIAQEFSDEHGVSDRLEIRSGDMFADELPEADVVLLSNILHDWDEPQCHELIGRAAGALRPGGRVLIHDVFLNDALDGPLPMALYSAALFTLTEGRVYSAAEYRSMLKGAGLEPASEVVSTLIHCGVLAGQKT
jgi:predicted O-methyltransferase YrrM